MTFNILVQSGETNLSQIHVVYFIERKTINALGIHLRRYLTVSKGNPKQEKLTIEIVYVNPTPVERQQQ